MLIAYSDWAISRPGSSRAQRDRQSTAKRRREKRTRERESSPLLGSDAQVLEHDGGRDLGVGDAEGGLEGLPLEDAVAHDARRDVVLPRHAAEGRLAAPDRNVVELVGHRLGELVQGRVPPRLGDRGVLPHLPVQEDGRPDESVAEGDAAIAEWGWWSLNRIDFRRGWAQPCSARKNLPWLGVGGGYAWWLVTVRRYNSFGCFSQIMQNIISPPSSIHGFCFGINSHARF